MKKTPNTQRRTPNAQRKEGAPHWEITISGDERRKAQTHHR